MFMEMERYSKDNAIIKGTAFIIPSGDTWQGLGLFPNSIFSLYLMCLKLNVLLTVFFYYILTKGPTDVY